MRSPFIDLFRRSPYVLLLSLLVMGCTKEPGIGARAEIHGRVMEQHHNNSGIPVGDPYPRPDHRVYIIYGDGTTPDDDVRTGADGRFRFPWLRKGNYTVYTLSECEVNISDCPSGTFAVSQKVDLIDRKELVDIGDLYIMNW